MWGMLAISFGMSLIGASKQNKAANMAGELGEKNAAAIAEETEEEIRRTELAQQQKTSQTVAAQGVSGIKMGGGTIDDYVKEMQSVFKSDIDWMKKSSASRESIARAEGHYAKAEGKARAWGTLSGGVGSLMSMWGG
jgi:hypothetical protein